jgi:hypothetical protein
LSGAEGAQEETASPSVRLAASNHSLAQGAGEEPDTGRSTEFAESGLVRCARALPDLGAARERAVAYLHALGLLERRAADGLHIGIQSTLATSAGGANAIDLGALSDDLLSDPMSGDVIPFPATPVLALWRAVAAGVERELGFRLEPELFSNMVFCAHAASVPDERIQKLARGLLRTFRSSDAAGLYHFFTSLRFACDIDCTGVAVRARLALGDIDLRTPAGVAQLRKSTQRILQSAAASDINSATNRSHRKDNGELRRLVFKVYPDDHEVQGSLYDRGLKNDAVVVGNALQCLLTELRAGLRSAEEIIPLKEYLQGELTPCTGQAAVAEILAANLDYITRHLFSGAWRDGTRYYSSPDVFLLCLAELVSRFPELPATVPALMPVLRAALAERTSAPGRGSLELALSVSATVAMGGDPRVDLEELIARQSESGSWDDFCPLFRLGSRSPQIFFGSVAQNTAFALRAITAAERPWHTELDDAPSHPAWFSAVAELWLRSLDGDLLAPAKGSGHDVYPLGGGAG